MAFIKRVLPFPVLLLISFLFVLSACSDPEFDTASLAVQKATKDVAQLEKYLQADAGKNIKDAAAFDLPNVKYLRQYADILRRSNPEMTDLIATLEAEGTVKGGNFSLIRRRLDQVEVRFAEEAKKSRASAVEVGVEASSISGAADVQVFNDSLVDVVNVLADMSKGKLPKLAFAETKDISMPPTQHLVGNPAYGQWSSGGFWQWYGQYRLFSDVLGWGSGYRYNQDRWYRSRSASYYGDVGRHYYGTDRNNRSWSSAGNRQPSVASNKAPAATVKKFKSSNRLSNYAPKTSGAPKSIKSNYSSKRVSSYSNSRSSPSRSGGFRSKSLGK